MSKFREPGPNPLLSRRSTAGNFHPANQQTNPRGRRVIPPQGGCSECDETPMAEGHSVGNPDNTENATRKKWKTFSAWFHRSRLSPLGPGCILRAETREANRRGDAVCLQGMGGLHCHRVVNLKVAALKTPCSDCSLLCCPAQIAVLCVPQTAPAASHGISVGRRRFLPERETPRWR